MVDQLTARDVHYCRRVIVDELLAAAAAAAVAAAVDSYPSNDRLACGNGGDRSSIVRIVDSVLLLMLLSLTSVDDSSWQIYVFVRAQRT